MHDRTASSAQTNPRTDHILVVDDDPMLLQLLANFLDEHKFSVRAAAGHHEFVRHIRESEPSLVVLDVNLGRHDGLEILRDLRLTSDVPVILISGHRPSEIDRIWGLELGADDYVVKPFSLRELLARIRAILGRQEMGRASRARETKRGGYRIGGWRVERRGRVLIDPLGIIVRLTRGEFTLLVAFFWSHLRDRFRVSICCKRQVFVRNRSTEVLIRGYCGCAESSSWTQVHRTLSGPSAASDTRLPFRWSCSNPAVSVD
jgi:two-component system, OmpR family, response regulator